MTNPSLIFVHIGKQFPGYLAYAIEQARLFNPEIRIFLLGNEEAFLKNQVTDPSIESISIESLKESLHHQRFNRRGKADGFWRYTLERFLVLDDFIQQNSISNVFHIENDVMIYFNIHDNLARFQNCYPNMLAAVFDCDERCVPSFIYISNPKISSKLSQFIAKISHLGIHDMEAISLFKDKYYKTDGDHLPILIPSYAEDYPLTNISKKTARSPEPFYNHLNDLKIIFDGAALGQFLGGIDPILGESNSGFLNEDSIFLAMHFDFSWETDVEGRWIPYIAYRGSKYPIANLHIHSKALHRFSSSRDKMPDIPNHFFSNLPFDHIQPKKNKSTP
jgi:hypothetical protein